MSIQVTSYADERIIVITMSPPIITPDDPIATLQACVGFKATGGTPVCRILDFSKTNIDFSSMMMGMAAERGQQGGSSDPEVRTIFVGSGELVAFGVKALQEQEQYGSSNNVIGLYTTIEEALAHARSVAS